VVKSNKKMNNSFKIFTAIIGLLIALVMLRLNSITFPRDREKDSRVIYLDEFHNSGGLFDIFYKDGNYFLKTKIPNINISGRPVQGTIEITDGDIISVRDKRFIFNTLPHRSNYREVFRRTILGLFSQKDDVRYIGGWITTGRQGILADSSNRSLLKKILVEVEASEVKKLIPPGMAYDGKLLDLTFSAGTLRVKSGYLPFHLIRDRKEQKKKKNTSLIIKDGDILKFPYRDSKNHREGLFIKFNFPRIRGADYLSISYKAEVRRFGKRVPVRKKAFLKSLDTGAAHSIDNTRQNSFIGDKGLFSFNLNPKRLWEKLFIPDRISEGGLVDIKELLDNRMYYRRDNRFYPVSPEFLSRLRKAFEDTKDIEDVRNYFAEKNIIWREFSNFYEFKEFLAEADASIKKMANKGIYRLFQREIEKLNSTDSLVGVGLSIPRSSLRRVTYKVPGLSWLEAENIKANTPIINGIENFYWGNLIKDSDNTILFRFTFNRQIPELRIIAPADYGAGFDGRQYNNRNFFDGALTLEIPEGKRELFVRIKNLNTFNRFLGAANFQARIIFTNAAGEEIKISTDDTWMGSIDEIHWSNVSVNPLKNRPSPKAQDLVSIWFNEKWNPIFSGIKSRFFRKKFQLKELPDTVKWEIFTPGHYLVRVNRLPVETEQDFLAALRRGRNQVTVMLTRRGLRKHFYPDMLFEEDNGRIVLKQMRKQQAAFKNAVKVQKPTISDMNGIPLVYNCDINGEQHRFYSPWAETGLLSILGNPAEGTWGLEQIFSNLYELDQIRTIRLTVNKQWQSMALKAMGKLLHTNREEELANPEYIELSAERSTLETELRQKQRDLATVNNPGNREQQKLMLEIIRLQNRIDEVRAEINKIKNHFYEAAVVLMTPKGEIRAAASYPYNQETMEALNPHLVKPYRPGENPFVNRCWEWKYNPGSTAKILDSVAFLESRDRKDGNGKYIFPYLRRLLTSEAVYKHFPRADLKGSRMLNGKVIGFRLRNFQGHNVPPGFCSLTDAFAHSYNTYFSYLALHNHRVLTLDSLIYEEAEQSKYRWYYVSKANIPVSLTYREYPLLEFAEKLMMNRKIDLLYNLRDSPIGGQLIRLPNDGLMSVASRFPVNAYSSANIAHYSIGQGDFQLTALQNALIAASVLNRGVLYHPGIIAGITFKNNIKPFIPVPDRYKIQVYKPDTAGQIKDAMKETVEHGTAAGLFHDIREGRKFFAKTGTAETEVYKDNSLFVGFVEFRKEDPLIFSVIVPRSGQGARVAGKLAEQILSEIITYENKRGKNF